MCAVSLQRHEHSFPETWGLSIWETVLWWIIAFYERRELFRNNPVPWHYPTTSPFYQWLVFGRTSCVLTSQSRNGSASRHGTDISSTLGLGTAPLCPHMESAPVCDLKNLVQECQPWVLPVNKISITDTRVFMILSECMLHITAGQTQ